MPRLIAPVAFLLLSACQPDVAGMSEADVANQAESLERAAAATTNQLIDQIAEDAAAREESIPAPVENTQRP